ncbi:MAG: zinc transporter ZupT [Candidatus Gracilibacteria bacterium]|nr:zinc transporter ZupT [Candidatus Gracilibacteria bacterium]
MDSSVIFTAFALTFLAGISTGIGGALACFTKHTNTKLLSVGLGFSAGVMIYISFMEIFPAAQKLLVGEFGQEGNWLALAVFFGGMLLSFLIDKAIPENFGNPHEIHHIEEMEDKASAREFKRIFRTGILISIAITLHNLPEGLVTFASALNNLKLGIPIAVAVAIHNIPEGIAVAIPIYYATKSRRKAFLYSLLSGLAEPVGAILGYFFLAYLLSDSALGIILAAVAGIMIFISFDELLPTAEKYGKHHLTLYGLLGGMLTIAASLILLA